MDRACGRNGGEWECIKDIGGKARRPRRRWVDNIKMDHMVIGWDGMD
jgi:hypothetical protein